MRKYLPLLCLFLFALVVHTSAQNIPDGTIAPVSKTPVKTPVTADPSLFYQRVFTPNKPITDSSLIDLQATVDDIGVTTQYIDGMGRPLETVIKQASPLKKDLVAPTAFDAFGNSSVEYLPYAAQTGNTNDGLFKTSPFKADSAFYSSQFPNEDIYYGKILFDASPLNKTTKQMAAGNSWAGSNKGISYSDRANTVADSVRIWGISITGVDDVPVTTAKYPAGSLFVKEITDERGNETVSYTDEMGRTVLTKTQLSSSPSADHTGWLCTYYVYDEMSHLRFVISPKATSFLLTNSWDLVGNSDVVSNLCYSYWYDDRGRVIEKHIPGKGKMYIAYDLYDRAVMTQDENLRTTNQWSFIKYDGQSRPDTAGLITSSLTPIQVVANAAGSKDYPALTGTYTVLTVNYYDNYTWITGGIPGGTLTTTNINSTNFITSYNTSPYYAQQVTQSNRIHGMVTGTKKLVLNSSTYLYAVNIYDERSRLIQTKQTNYTGGTDVATSQYDFSGKALRNHLQHQKLGNNTINHTLLTKYSYDHVGRLKSIIKNIDGQGDKTTVQNAYNELGQLSSKLLGTPPSGGAGGLETQSLTYNIRGWLNGINKTYVEAPGGGGYFGEELFYDYGFSTTFTNGNIAGVKWKSTGDDIQRAYGFGYDIANRLIKADFTQQNTGSTSWTSDKMDFSVSGLKYDANGGITAMTQQGVNVNTPLTIDSLAYTYFTNSNQLQKVKDLSGSDASLGDFTDSSGGGDDYSYDINGNMITDLNKHIVPGTGISYNFLDKPVSINVSGKGNINYTYDAAGAMLQKTITDTKTNIKTVITYIAGFVYQKVLPSSGNASAVPDTLQYALHEEGRIRYLSPPAGGGVGGGFYYDYFLKDHLGNIRSVITDEQDTDAYPDASLESSTLNTEKIYYDNLDAGRVNKTAVPGYPNDGYTNPNDYIQKLNGSATKVGASILLKVMAGDKITVRANSWYNNGAAPGTPVNPLTDIVNALINSVPAASGSKFATTQLSTTVLNPDVTQFLNNRNANNVSTRPKAYFNIVLLDEQLNPVITNDGKNSYFEQVSTSGTIKTHSVTDRQITKSGYVYIYVSNETPNIDVYFDNLQVTHTKGPLLQEEGYYPFGLEMKAIGSQAALKPQTNYKFNAGTNLESSFDVDYYETYFRNYDAQIGRFTGIDAMAEQSINLTTYQFGNNNPIYFNDPTGLLSQQEFDDLINILWNSPYGGSWSADGGGGSTGISYGGGSATVFSSAGQGFAAGAAGMFANNSWGQNGWASSYGSASNSYYQATGEKPPPLKYGYNKEGQYGVRIGYTGYSDNYSSTGLRDVVVGSEFVSWSDYFGNTSETDNNTQKAWYGNFVGPGPDQNPFKLIGPNGEYLKPIDMVDAAAQRHDYAYWKASTGGIRGALFNTTVRQADLDLAHDAEWVILFDFLGLNDAVTGKAISPAEYHWAVIITIGFNDLGTLKSF